MKRVHKSVRTEHRIQGALRQQPQTGTHKHSTSKNTVSVLYNTYCFPCWVLSRGLFRAEAIQESLYRGVECMQKAKFGGRVKEG